jgi:WD40 repeat protein
MSLTPEQPAAPPSGLYPDPVVVIDPEMHTSKIEAADIDAEARWVVTGSDDKTVRVWSLEDGSLLTTIRLPAGPDRVGLVYSVAMSPDGSLIAAGGWTQLTGNQTRQIYLFDRVSGKMVQRVEGLPAYAIVLAFSSDGERLAATLDGRNGLRIYGRSQGWAEIGRDEDYNQPSYGAAFASDGRLATTALDGGVRIYGKECAGHFSPMVVAEAPSGSEPLGIAFSPDGSRLALGYSHRQVVDVSDGLTLARLPGPDCSDIKQGELSTVAWSRDGGSLYAAHIEDVRGGRAILAWDDAGLGKRRELPAGRDSVMSIVPLPGNDLLVASADPWLARLQPDGSPRWVHESPNCDFRDQGQQLYVANDGSRIEFGFEQGGKPRGRLDLSERTLTLDPPTDSALTPARQTGLSIDHWRNAFPPTFNGQPMRLDQRELCRSLAIHPSGDRFVLGTEWWLLAFDANGKRLWGYRAPADVWAVNITGDGRLVVAACGDGTVRWLRMDNGAELLGVKPLPDQINWVAWTPEGFYAATPVKRDMLRWHVNQSFNEAADSVPIDEIKGSFRPSILPLVLEELEIVRALGRALSDEHKLQITVRTKNLLPKAAQLVVLTIGISKYNEEFAKHLQLQFAERDASDLALALSNTQGSLYDKVLPQALLDAAAKRIDINRSLTSLRSLMKQGRGDLAVVHFSGHGAQVDDKLYLLPYDVDARDEVGIQSTGLSIDDLNDHFLHLAALGRVLVLLDACHSGAMTMDGSMHSMSGTELRAGIAATNVTVLTSSSDKEMSQERPEWQHGAFTKAVLDALIYADTDHDGLIGPNEFAEYVGTRVLSLTGGAQTPGMNSRYYDTLFAAQL